MSTLDVLGTAGKRLRRDADSVTVSYRRESDGVYATTVGYGATLNERVADADAKLPAGEWLRLCVSTPVSIYGDLVGRDAPLRNAEEWRGMIYMQHERRIVVVP